jgi:drug/metabolite transporter (DMT)-like permease
MHKLNTPIGITLWILAMAVNASKDGLAKLLAENYTPLLILLIQFSVTSLILAPVVISKSGLRAIIPNQIFAQILRSVFMTTGVGLFYWAINYIHIADATAMVFVSPLIVTALSPSILGEPLGFRRTIAVVVGFIGVLIILRPTMEGDRTGYFIALAAGFFLAAFYIASRKLAITTPILESTFYTSFISLLLILPLLSTYWSTPNFSDLIIFFGFTILATLGQILMVSAFSFATASVIAPFVYTQIIWATIVGYFLFGVFPDREAWLGIAIVASAGVYIAVREINLTKDS